MSRHAVVLGASIAAGLAWCLSVTPLVHGDPLLALELGSVALVGAWLFPFGFTLLQARRLAAGLDRLSSAAQLAGVPVKIVRGAGRVALVTGALRPAIYIGQGLMEDLTDDEQVAVLLHEDHHRATFAPLRAAALEAWLSVVGRSRYLRRTLTDRLVDLETMADSYAINSGASRTALAAALIKTDAAKFGMSASSYGTQRRIHALLEKDGSRTRRYRLPYEWLPVAVVTVAATACHVWGAYSGVM